MSISATGVPAATVPSTRQLSDPAGTLSVYPTTISLTALAFGLALLATIGEVVRGAHLGLLLVAIALFSTSCIALIVGANPSRAPFRGHTHFVVHAGAVLAYICAVVATPAGGGRFLADGWAAVGLGILTIAVAPYRPIREQVAAGSMSAVFISFAASARAETTMPDVPPLAVAIGTVLPILAFCYANAVYSAATIRSLERAQQRAGLAADALSDELRDGIVQDVRHDRASILQLDVVPFLSRVAAQGGVDDADRARATQIADSIRQVMVAEAERTWLAVLLGQLGARVDDPTLAAARFNGRQRTSMRALVVTARDDPAAGEISVVLNDSPEGVAGTISLHVDAPEGVIRSTYSPYFAVMRVAFSTASLDVDAPYLIVRFTL